MSDFISIQIDYWDNPWQNRHSFIWELSNHHKVFFLTPPFHIEDLISRSSRTKTSLLGLNELKDNLYVYTPSKYLPTNYRFPSIDKIIKNIRLWAIKRNLTRLRFENPVLYFWHPAFAEYIDHFPGHLIIYHKYDNYAGYEGGTGFVSEKEKKLFEKADLVLVTSQGLYEMHKNDHPDIHVVPNGVDYDLFSKPVNDKLPIPGDLAAIPKPRIGYVGVINEKVDFDLLIAICKKNPKWSIVLVGLEKVKHPAFRIKLAKLREQSNCYFLGMKDYFDVPKYVFGLDVCMMCYVINDWTYYGYPLKLHEYLACGKPSVASPLPALHEFNQVVSLAETPIEWSNAIDYWLKNDNEELALERKKIAEENSWRNRVKTVEMLIQNKSKIKQS